MYAPSLITTIQLQTTQSIFSELNEKQAQELNKVMNYQLLFIFLKFNIVILTLLKNLQERTYV